MRRIPAKMISGNVLGEIIIMRIAISAAVLALAAAPAAADTITAKEIAAGLSDRKTELAQKAWWDEHLKNRRHEITGKIDDVEEGTFSGYWVNLDIGQGIRVQCGMSNAYKAVVMDLGKGQRFTCKGKVGNTWTAIFGVQFIMNMEAPDQQSSESGGRRKSLLLQLME